MMSPTINPNSLEETIAVFKEIVEGPGLFRDDEEKDACRRLIDELTDEEVEMAANTSYAYWFLASKPEHCPSASIKIHMAMREARRHYVGEGRKYKKALSVLREALSFRKKYNVIALRTCFNDVENNTPEENALMEGLIAEYDQQIMVVRGYDRENRAIVTKYIRDKTDDKTTDIDYLMAQIYAADRGIAATEFMTRGTTEKLISVFDFENYDNKNAPPFSALKLSVKVMQRMFPERLQTLVVLQPPMAMKALHRLLSPFLSKETKDKVRLASTLDEKINIFNQLIDKEQAMPRFLPDGDLVADVNRNHFLTKVPYHCLYDDLAQVEE